MQFAVRHVRNGDVRITEETLEAVGATALRTRLEASGSLVLEVRGSPASAGAQSGLDVANWCREIETLVRAGMTVVEAVETISAEDREVGRRQQINRQLLERMRSGSSLSQAMMSTDAFPLLLIAGVTASERTSTLPEALRHYLRHEDLLSRLRRTAVSAAVYPTMVVAVGAVVALFLLLYVIPRFARLYGETDRSMSAGTQFVLWVSQQLLGNPALVLLGVGLFGATVFAAWSTGGLARLGEWVVEALPFSRRQSDNYRLAKLYQSLAMLTRGGYNLDEALAVSAGMKLGDRAAKALQAARQAIANGQSASKALAEAGLADATARRLLVVGERTGAVADVLETISERHAGAFSLFIERATRIVEPTLLLLVAMVVGALIVMMYLPIFDIAGSVRAVQ